MTDVCPDCGCLRGQLHELFCTKERCPFCGGQLASCDCIGKVLKLTEEEIQIVEEYEDDDEQPLKGIVARWAIALGKKGRIPF